MQPQHERLSVYRIMPDDVLVAAIADLEQKVIQLSTSRTPVAERLKESYFDALTQARLEQARRRC